MKADVVALPMADQQSRAPIAQFDPAAKKPMFD
jgi:hypothetical protein